MKAGKKIDNAGGPRPYRTVRSGGYIALMAVIFISMILMTIAVAANLSGFFTRFNVLEGQEKLQSNALAESCVNIAMLRLTQNVSYPYSLPETVNLGASNCNIKGITTTPSSDPRKQQKQIDAGANFIQAFTNFSVGSTINYTDLASSQAAVLVLVLVNNSYGGTLKSSDFVVDIDATNPSPSQFSNDNTAGTPIYMDLDPGASSTFKASVDLDSLAAHSNYSVSYGDGCGNPVPLNVSAGDTSNICIITLNNIPTTATLVAVVDVSNQYMGTKNSSDFPLSMKINNVITNIYSGAPTAGLPPGTYHIIASPSAGYSNPFFNPNECAGGDITLAAGDVKTCTITYSDIVATEPVCSNTVMMIDRSNSMPYDDLNTSERAIAEAFLDWSSQAINVTSIPDFPFFQAVPAPPKIGFGGMGGLNGTPAWVPNGTGNYPSGLLTNTANADGKTFYGTSGTTDHSTEARPPSTVGGDYYHYQQWTNPENAYANKGSYATSSTDGDMEVYKNFNFSVPADASITGIEVSVKGKYSPPILTSDALVPLSTTDTGYDWNTYGPMDDGDKVASVLTNDGDSRHIEDSSQGDTQTYTFANANIPDGSVIDSITLTAIAKGDGWGINAFELEALSKKDGITSSVSDPIIPPSNYTKYSYTFTNDPYGQPWTLDEVKNNWNTTFGVLNSGSINNVAPYVTQLYLTVNYTGISTGQLAPAVEEDFLSGYYGPPWMNPSGLSGADAVKENDGDSSYIFARDLAVSLYTFPGATDIPDGSTINSVTLTAYAKALDGSPTFALGGGSYDENQIGTYGYNPTAFTPVFFTLNSDSLDYKKYDFTTTTDPTGQPWTLDEVRNWTTPTAFGVGKISSNDGTVAVTQLYLTVNYTPSPTPNSLEVDLSPNGNIWTASDLSSKFVDLSQTETTYPSLGSSTDTWNEPWSPSDFSNGNFQVLLTNISPSAGSTTYVDGLTVKVYYTELGTGLRGAMYRMTASGSGTDSDIAAEINAGRAELNSYRRDSNQPKALILMSNGVPTDDQDVATTAANDAKDPTKNGGQGINIFTIHYGTNNTGQLAPKIAIESDIANGYYGWMGVNGRDYSVSYIDDPVMLTQMAQAVATDDKDSSYVGSNPSALGDQTFNFYGAGIPDGSTINSVTLTAVAYGEVTTSIALEAVSSDRSISSVGPSDNLTYTYEPYSYTMTTDPKTNKKWAVDEVNNWRHTNFGVTRTSIQGNIYVTQLYLTVNYIPPSNIDDFLTSLSSGTLYSFGVSKISDVVGPIIEGIAKEACPAIDYVPQLGRTPPLLKILTVVTNNNGGSKIAGDFLLHWWSPPPPIGTNPVFTFHALDWVGAHHNEISNYTSDSYVVTEDPVLDPHDNTKKLYEEVLSQDCSGSLISGQTKTCVISNDDVPPPAPEPPTIQAPPAIQINTWQEIK